VMCAGARAKGDDAGWGGGWVGETGSRGLALWSCEHARRAGVEFAAQGGVRGCGVGRAASDGGHVEWGSTSEARARESMTSCCRRTRRTSTWKARADRAPPRQVSSRPSA
jgi:hypothetical protein